MPAPRYLTPRNPARSTYGPAIGKIAGALGLPPMPWQAAVNNLVGEIDPDTGRLFYSLVVITVQRQAGKTATNLSTGVHRSLAMPSARVWYTAQTGLDARENFLEMGDPATRSPLGRLFDLKRGSANTAMEFVNGSRFKAHPPTPGAMHGKQSDLNLVDEAWEYSVPQGNALMSGIAPAQSTRHRPPFLGAQTIVLSTRGTAESEWLDAMIDQARDHPRAALVDFGVPDDEDPADFATIARYHPAFGHTMDMAALHAARAQMSEAEFIRGYANRATGTKDPVVSDAVLDRATTAEKIPEGVPFTVGAATSYDRSWSVVVVVAEVTAGRYVTEVVEAGPGVTWAADLLDQIVAARRPIAAAVDPVGPSGRLADACSTELRTPTARDLATATDDLIARITDESPSLVMRHDAGLRRAWRGVALRHGEAGRVFSRKYSVGSIAEIEAVLVALWAITHPPEPEPEFVFITSEGAPA